MLQFERAQTFVRLLGKKKNKIELSVVGNEKKQNILCKLVQPVKM